ncbi:phage baseplate plug family protein [Brevibacillus centrosporus]|uniref:phage baseplate plug family protein n=1 Tax=Brevibacillus centrosporus TaxID=54910 RepID=UPI003B01AA41
MAAVLLPIRPSTNQKFTCTLPVRNQNITLEISLTYNQREEYWFMAISDHTTGIMLIDSLPLIAGTYPAANLLGPYEYLGIGSAAVVSANGDDSTPTFESLGKEHFVVWYDNLS